MPRISPLAVIDPKAAIGRDVAIGPFCVIGPEVQIGDACELANNVTLEGRTRLGERNVLYPNVVVGAAPQDLKYNGEPTETSLGPRNVLRENVTVHRGTALGRGRTDIGSGNLLMAGSHVAHDCVLGDDILLGNGTLLAGHVVVEDGAVLSGLVGIHHFVTVGRLSYVAGLTAVRRDVPPYVKFSGDPNRVRGLNAEGLRRRGLGADDVAALKRAYRLLFGPNADHALAHRLDELQASGPLSEHVAYLCAFLRRSLAGRFGRYLETHRQDGREDRRYRRPAEVRE